jgi:hypothetical protein
MTITDCGGTASRDDAGVLSPGSTKSTRSIALLDCTPAGKQIKDQNDQSDDQQDMYQAAANVAEKTQQPQDQYDD